MTHNEAWIAAGTLKVALRRVEGRTEGMPLEHTFTTCVLGESTNAARGCILCKCWMLVDLLESHEGRPHD